MPPTLSMRSLVLVTFCHGTLAMTHMSHGVAVSPTESMNVPSVCSSSPRSSWYDMDMELRRCASVHPPPVEKGVAASGAQRGCGRRKAYGSE